MALKRRRKKSSITNNTVTFDGTFPTELSTPAGNIRDYVTLIYGPPGVGKTSLASRFGRTMHFMFGDRDVSLRIHKKQIESWPQFEHMVDVWPGQEGFDTAVVDVTEEAYEMCFSFMCDGIIKDTYGTPVPHPQDAEDRGKSWKLIKRRFVQPIQKLIACDRGLVLISHAKHSTRSTLEGEELEDVHPAMSGQALEAMVGLSDVVGYYSVGRGEARTLQIQPTYGVLAKCRPHENFRHADGSRVDKIPMGSSPEEAYANLTKAFDNQLPPPERTERRKTKLKRTKKTTN